MKSRSLNFLSILAAGCVLSCSSAMALDCSDPAPTPTPTYNMNPAVTPDVVETPAAPEELPASRDYCRQEKSACKAANTNKKRTISKEKTRKAAFTKYKGKSRKIQANFTKCKNTVTRRIRQFKTRIQPMAERCGGDLRDLVNNTVSVDFFSCRSNMETLRDWAEEALSNILEDIVAELQGILERIIDTIIRHPDRAVSLVAKCRHDLDELALHAMDGSISAECRTAINNFKAASERDALARQAACNQMERYRHQAQVMASSLLNCADRKATATDRYHDKLMDVYENWVASLTDKKTAEIAAPILCSQYNRHCR